MRRFIHLSLNKFIAFDSRGSSDQKRIQLLDEHVTHDPTQIRMRSNLTREQSTETDSTCSRMKPTTNSTLCHQSDKVFSQLNMTH